MQHGKFVKDAAVELYAVDIPGRFLGPMLRWLKDDLTKGRQFLPVIVKIRENSGTRST